MKNKRLLYLITVFLIFFCLTHGYAKNRNTLKNSKGESALRKKYGQPGDPNIKYFGRWDFSDPGQFISYWGGAYFKVNFSGTSAKIRVGNKSNYYAKIDGGPWISYLNVGGVIDLTPVPLTAGEHTLSVAQGKDYNYVFSFEGLLLDDGAKTMAPSVSANLIEYIGDSITTGYTDAQADVSDYAWICSENMNCEHTQIAYPGINLVSGYPSNGMGEQYFKQRSLAYPDSKAWDFAGYTPKLIVINLGTNDTNHKIPDFLFQSVYLEFLTKIRNKFPAAEIFVLKTFSGTKDTATLGAVNSRNKLGDNKVHYVNTSGWLISKEDFNDSAHPNVKGHLKAAALLQRVLAPYINNTNGSGQVK